MFVLSLLLFIISFIQLLWSLIRSLGTGMPSDLAVYVEYTRLFLASGNPYIQNVPLNYPPSSLLLFVPITLLPSSWITILFTLASLASLVTSIFLICRCLRKNVTFFFLIIAILLQLFPTKFTLGMGQINLIVLLFTVSGLFLDWRGKEVLGGILIGLGSALKLSPLSLLLYFLIQRRWKAFLSTILTFSILNGVPMIFDASKLAYFSNHLPTLLSSVNNASSLYDQSLKAFLIRLGSNKILFNGLYLLYILPLMTIGVLFLLGRRQHRKMVPVWHSLSSSDNLLPASLILALTTLGNSFAWQHHFVFFYPLVILLLAKPPPKWWSRITLALGVLMLASKSFASGGFFGLITENTTVIGGLILISLTVHQKHVLTRSRKNEQ